MGKTFKFQVSDPKLGKWYLADASGRGTQDPSKALTCELAGDSIKCGGKGFASFPVVADMTKLSAGAGSSGWSVDASGNINWTARSNMKFSIRNTNEIWAEVCPDLHGHFAGHHGNAKAVFDA